MGPISVALATVSSDAANIVWINVGFAMKTSALNVL